MASARTILFGLGMGMWVTLFMNLRVRCVMMNNVVWFGFRGQSRVARVWCRPCQGRLVSRYLRISGRVSIIRPTVPGTMSGRSGCGTGQRGVVGGP